MKNKLIPVEPQEGLRDFVKYFQSIDELTTVLFSTYVNYTRLALKWHNEGSPDIDADLYYFSSLINMCRKPAAGLFSDEFPQLEDFDAVRNALQRTYVNYTKLLIKYPDDNNSDDIDIELYSLSELINIFQSTYTITSNDVTN